MNVIISDSGVFTTKKRVECIATWGRPTPCQSLSPSITIALDHAKFVVAQPIRCRLIAFFYCWYVTLNRDLDLWPCDLDILPFTLIIWCSQTLHQIQAQSSNPRRSYCHFNI